MKAGRTCILLAAAALLGACASGPESPAWSLSAVGHVERFRSAWLDGRERVAALEFQQARDAVARTGKASEVARVELNRCALHVAVLDFEPCTGFEAIAADAAPAEQAYARYLAGSTQTGDLTLLPAGQRAVASGGALATVADPLSRLVAAGVRFRGGAITPADVETAVATASDQGWRKPLLAWLMVQARAAEKAGDTAGAAYARRRIELVGSSAAR